MAKETIRKILTHDFIHAFLAQFAFTIAHQLLIPTLPLYLSRLGSRETEIGVLIGALSVSSLVLRPFVGRALLRISEKRLMIIGGLISAVASFAYLLTPPFWPLLTVRIFQGMGVAFFYTASFTLVGNISPETHRGQSISYFYLSLNLSLAVSPSLGMFLVNRFGFTLLFGVCLAASSCSLFVTSRLKTSGPDQSKESSGEKGAFLDRKALSPSFVGFFFYIIWGTLTTFFPLYAINNGVANPGFFFTTIAIMLISGRALGGRILDLYSRERMIPILLFVCAVSMSLLAFSRNLPMFILVGVILGIGMAFLTPAVMAYTLDRAGTSRGPAMATFTGLSDLGVSLGPVIMGIIIRLTSYPIMFLCLALVGVINFSFFFLFVKKKSHRLAPGPWDK